MFKKTPNLAIKKYPTHSKTSEGHTPKSVSTSDELVKTFSQMKDKHKLSLRYYEILKVIFRKNDLISFP